MIDLVQLQNDLTFAMQCAERLANVNIVQYRKLRLQSELDGSTVWLTDRNGRSGCGILVEMPEFHAVDANVPGPQGQISVSFAVLEEPNLNFASATGTLLSAEDVAQIIQDELHLGHFEGLGEFYCQGKSLAPANEFPPGIVAYRVTLNLRVAATQTARVNLPDISEAALSVTLTNTTDGADIYYTLDGTFPGPANPGAIKYTVPFDATGAAEVRWAAYKAGMVGSFVGQVTNPNA